LLKEGAVRKRAAGRHLPFALALAILGSIVANAVPAQATVGSGIGWHVVCTFSHRAQDDPIVMPGMPGMAAHMHDFYGNTGTDASSTTDSLLAGQTTCSDPFDESGYWVPELMYRGVAHQAAEMVVYYRAETTPYSDIQPLPQGLRIIAGNSHATRPQSTDVVSWSCQFDRPRSMPVDCKTKDVTAKIRFPSCWDGKNLDSADHQSHMAYTLASGACPMGYPVALPKVFMDLRFNGVHNGTKVRLASGPAYTLHADMFSAWQTNEQAGLVQSCIYTSTNCGRAMGMM
jgi:hypothetical protein